MPVLTANQVAFLRSQRVGRLATVDTHGRPHVVPVCFAVVDDNVYIAIDEKPKRGDPAQLRRLRNIAHNPAVSLVADRYDEDWERLAWLQVRGTASLLSDPDERSRVLAALRMRYPQYTAMRLEDRPIMRIVPVRCVGWAATGSAP